MNREILFRGKRTDNGEWCYGYLFDDGMVNSNRMFVGNIVIEDYKGSADDRFDITGIDFCEVDPDTICQYTGVKDKNGKKIFEGDIVLRKLCRHMHKKGEIVWLDIGACGFWLKRDGKHYSIGNTKGDGKSLTDSIIGNIFDNPELLNAD